MFTFTNNEILTNEKCFDNLYDLYITIYSMEGLHGFKNKLVLVLENKIMCELPLKMISVKWAVALAEKVLHIRPSDNRPILAIEASKRWIIDQTTDQTTTYASEAFAPMLNAFTAVAGIASVSAVMAASSAAVACNAAATDAAGYAAADAGYAVDVARADQQNWSRNKLKEIVYEYLTNYRHLLKNTLEHLIIPELSDIIIKYVI